MKSTAPAADPANDISMVRTLRYREFHAAVIFTVFSQSPLPAAMLCHLAGIPRTLAHCRENPYVLLSNWVRETEPDQHVRHEVRRQLDLVATIGCSTSDERLSMSISDDDRTAAATLLESSGVERDKPWLVVHPGATAPSRRYPPAKFAEVIRQLVERHGFQVVLTGMTSEQPLVDEIAALASVKTTSLAGRLSLGQLAAVIELTPVLISNNSGPVHIAAAFGTPVIDLYALTNPQHTPWLVPSRVLFNDVPCKNCFRSICPEGHHACLAGVEPESVVVATIDLLEECSSTAQRIDTRSATALMG